jgi:hypothetical protein
MMTLFRRRPSALRLGLYGLIVLLVTSATPGPAPSEVLAQTTAWSTAFDGRPDAPLPWDAPDWDIQVHSRDSDTWRQLEPMIAHHGPNCSAPPETHQTSGGYDEAVYQCNGHIMTAIGAGGYGAIYLTPNQLVDFSSGETVVQFDMSTFRSSGRDWVDVWLSPFDDQIPLPLQDWLPDLSGEPRRAVHILMQSGADGSIFGASILRDTVSEQLPVLNRTSYERFLTPSMVRRDTFELRISRTSLKFGMPAYNHWWVDTKMSTLDWDKAVLQFGHHSYNPTKDTSCAGSCSPNTWHWDNVTIERAQPFTLLKADQPRVDATTQPWVAFAEAAPAGSYLRFAGIGNALEVSFDSGVSWQAAQMHPVRKQAEEHFKPYWMPVPAGTSRVDFRGSSWWAGEWMVRGISIWSQTH